MISYCMILNIWTNFSELKIIKKIKIICLLFVFSFISCDFNINMNPAGSPEVNNPFYVTTEPTLVKKIMVPTGTILSYEKHFWKEGAQSKMMNESNLEFIKLPEERPIIWGGVPVYEIYKFFNPEMNGFTVYADFSKLDTVNINEFIGIWKNCSGDIGIDVKNIDDWSFNKENITDISSCGNHYQRFFEDNVEQQKFLDDFYIALQKVEN